MWWLLRKTTAGREPLSVTLSGVRAGERVLQINVDDLAVAAGIAAKVGLNGEAAIVVSEERTAALVRTAAAEAGALVDITVAPPDALPCEAAAFDLVVVHSSAGFLAGMAERLRAGVLRETARVLRAGGRVVVIEQGTPSGLGTWFRSAPPETQLEAAGATAKALESAGFRPVRQLADRGGSRFIEGIRSR